MTDKEHSKFVADEISNLINTTAFRPKEVADVIVNGASYHAPMHRYLQGELFKLAIAYIFELANAKETGRYDARNEAAVNNASEIVRLIKEAGVSFENNPSMWGLVQTYNK